MYHRPQFLTSLCELIAVVLFTASALEAQSFRREIDGIPVTTSGAAAAQPFAGGINTPNHQFVDIDGDGDFDLFILDNDGYVDFYRNRGTAASPRFVLEPGSAVLPSFMSFFLFADLNGDGKIDLVTDDSSSGMKYYENDGTREVPTFVLKASPMRDDSGNPMFAGFASVPAFADIDGDSLPDFFSNNSADGSINYYSNVGTKTKPQFRFITSSYQGITIIGDSCYRGGTVPAKRSDHGAGAYGFGDADGNGTQDLLIGDLFSTRIFYLSNQGTARAAQLHCTPGPFPPDGSLLTDGFNQPTLVDIDADGDLDLFVGALVAMPSHTFWFYENTGTASAPVFQLRSRDYLSMVDVGREARPALVDIDGDGDMDLVVGSLEGQLTFFRNDGTRQSPAFTLADTAFGHIGGSFTYAPAFGDIDGDGDQDLVLGTFSGRLKLYLNTGTAFSPRFTAVSSALDSVADAAGNASPVLVDIDGDGDLDLFSGRGNGKVSFFENRGDPFHFQPVLVTPNYGGIAAGENARPAFADIDHDGDADLIIGNSAGSLILYRNTGSATSPQFTFETNRFAGTDPMLDASPALADIDGDGDIDVFVGTSKGGLQFYRNEEIPNQVTGDPQPAGKFSLSQNYPNPFNPLTHLQFTVGSLQRVTLKIYTVLGREVAILINETKPPGTYSVEWNATGQPSGVYFYRLQAGSSVQTKKLVHLE